MTMTLWKPIKDYEDLYEVSSDGRVKSLYRSYLKRKEKVLLGSYDSDGNTKFILFRDSYGKQKYAYRLVAETFIPNPKGYHFVRHKDKDKNNNKVENLEWYRGSKHK